MNIQERVKLNRLKTSLPWAELAKYFSQNTYSDDKGYGYSAFEINDDNFGAIYTEKNVIENTATDPLGNEFSQIVTEYISIKFELITLSSKLYLLCVYNPPKSIKAFTDKVSADLNYKIGLSSIDIDLSKLYQVLREKHEVTLLKLSKIKISSLVINDNAKSSIEVISRKNAMDDLHELTLERKFKIDKMKINCLIDNDKSEIEISKTGTISGRSDQVLFYTEIIMTQLLDNEG